eukprot:Sspe_Gene.63639::Locus_36705_Transcript_1_1_Confidence_1.000_Length_1069::g.63639::m.63639
MAKIGEGDSRWIVTDREDGANCNNWHWTEKDISAWAFDEIKKAVENKDIHKDGQFSLTTKKVTDISGDCTVMNRKKKLICAFDISFDVEWEGKALERETGEVLWTDTGKFKVPDCDDTTVGDELQVNCTYKEVTGSFTEDIVKFARTHGVPFLRGVMMEFQKKLKDTHQITNKLPSQVSESKSPQSRGPTEVEVTQTGSIKWHIQWRCPPSEIFDALVNQGKVNAYTRLPVDGADSGGWEVRSAWWFDQGALHQRQEGRADRDGLAAGQLGEWPLLEGEAGLRVRRGRHYRDEVPADGHPLYRC